MERQNKRKNRVLWTDRKPSEMVVGYNMDEQGRAVYSEGIKVIVEVTEIKEGKVRIRLYGPGISYVRGELLPEEQRNAAKEIMKPKTLEGRAS